MKKIVVSILLLAAGISVKAQQKGRLKWADEFNYTGLPDSTKWNYEQGHIRNTERQYYTEARKENAFVHDGVLEIKGIREQYPNSLYKAGSEGWKTADSLAAYTSASLLSLGKTSFKYGRLEVRARLPKGKGVWPAIWMMGNNIPESGWPRCGEIDVMEFVGQDSSNIYGTVHYAKEDGASYSSSGNHITVMQPYNDFHVYGFEWSDQEMKFFFDDSIYHQFDVQQATIKEDNPFRKPFYIILNLALGGTWAGEIDDRNLPQSFLIDYVRVYSLEN